MEKFHGNHEDQTQEDKERVEDDLEEVDNLICTHKSGNPSRKMIKLCRHNYNGEHSTVTKSEQNDSSCKRNSGLNNERKTGRKD